MNMRGVIFFILLVFAGFILSAGCVYDRDLPVSSGNGEYSEDVYGLDAETENNDTGYEESYNTMSGAGIPDESEGYYSEEYAGDAYIDQIVVVSPDSAVDSDGEDDNDYVIDDDYRRTDGGPLDAVKNPENYSVQDSGTVILNTDSGEIEN